MSEMRTGYTNKLKNKIFGCLCAREEGKAWEGCLDNILMEMIGIPEEERGINFYIVYYKLSASRYFEYKYFRKVIFEVLSVLSGMWGDD